MSNIRLLRKCAFLQKQEASIAGFHHISQLGKVIKLNASRIFLNNLIGWTNTELSSDLDATVLHITKTTHAKSRISWTSILDVVAYCRSFFSVHRTIVPYRLRGQSTSALQRHMTSEHILMCVYTYQEHTHIWLLKKIKINLLFRCWTKYSNFLFQKAINFTT